MNNVNKFCTADQALLKLQTLCSRQETCKQDAVQKCKSWDLSEEAIENILNQLEKEKFIDEKRFAHFFTNDKLKFNHWGKIKISLALRQKQIPENIISEVLDEIDPLVYFDILRKELEKKVRLIPANHNSYQIKISLLRYAYGKGFDSREIEKLLPEILMKDKN